MVCPTSPRRSPYAAAEAARNAADRTGPFNFHRDTMPTALRNITASLSGKLLA